jgi:hypothetical protein
MALGPKPFTATVLLTTTAATTVVATPATNVTRYIKHIKVTNGGTAATFTLGLKATTTAPAAGDPGLIALTKAVAANDSVDLYFTGDGLAWAAASALNLNGSASAATQVSVDVIGVEVVS